MNPAVRAARAMIEIIGFTPGAVGNRLPSPIHRFGTSCDSPVGFAAEVFGSVPALAEPIGWAENRATPSRECRDGPTDRGIRRTLWRELARSRPRRNTLEGATNPCGARRPPAGSARPPAILA